jgi:integrase
VPRLSAHRLPKLRRQPRDSGRDLAFVELDDRRVYLGTHGSPEARQEYNRVTAEWLANGRSVPVRRVLREDGRPILVKDILAGYWQYAEKRYVKNGKPTSEVHRIRSGLRPARRLYGHIPAAEFDVVALETCRAEFVRDGDARKTCNYYTRYIRAAFRWGVRNKLVPAEVLTELDTLEPLLPGRTEAPERRVIEPPPEEHIEAVRPLVSRQVWAMIGVQRHTACRPGEVCVMKPCDIDMVGRTVDGVHVWLYRPPGHKTMLHEIDRIIPIGPRAQEIIRPFLLGRTSEAYIFSPNDAEAERRERQREERQSPMTPSQAARRPKKNPAVTAGDHYTEQAYCRAIVRACETLAMQALEEKHPELVAEMQEKKINLRDAARQAGVIVPWTPGQLRHEGLTRTDELFGLGAAQAVGGHTSARTTEIYLSRRRGLRLAAQVAAKIG